MTPVPQQILVVTLADAGPGNHTPIVPSQSGSVSLNQDMATRTTVMMVLPPTGVVPVPPPPVVNLQRAVHLHLYPAP